MKLNLPNKLTLLRIASIPFFMVFLIYPFFGADYVYINRIIGGLFFIVSAVTDYFDGYLARKNDQVTDFGKFMDPLADKFLIFGALIAIFFSEFVFVKDSLVNYKVTENIFFWITIIVIFRELAVTSMRLVVSKNEGTVVAASKLAKVKTGTQIVCVALFILEPVVCPFTGGLLSFVSMFVMLVFTVWSGYDYFKTYWKFLDPNK